MKVVCVKKNEFFKHHEKIQIGDIYLGERCDWGWSIRTFDNRWIGFYHEDQFVSSIVKVREEKINSILIGE